jgi:hypothetical protein
LIRYLIFGAIVLLVNVLELMYFRDLGYQQGTHDGYNDGYEEGRKDGYKSGWDASGKYEVEAENARRQSRLEFWRKGLHEAAALELHPERKRQWP